MCIVQLPLKILACIWHTGIHHTFVVICQLITFSMKSNYWDLSPEKHFFAIHTTQHTQLQPYTQISLKMHATQSTIHILLRAKSF